MDRKAGGVYQGIAVSAGTCACHWCLFWTSDCGAGDGRRGGEE